MFDKCFAKIVTGANGKPLTQAQRDNLRKRFSAAFLESAKSGNDAGDAILRALEKMRADAIHETKLKQHRAMLNAAAQSQLETFARANADKFKGGAADAIWRMISTHSDRLSNIQSAESFRNALIRKYSHLPKNSCNTAANIFRARRFLGRSTTKPNFHVCQPESCTSGSCETATGATARHESSDASPQRTKTGAHVVDIERGLLKRGEMTALWHVGPVRDVV